MSYSTIKLLENIKEYLATKDIKVEFLKTKDDLNKIATHTKVFLQLVENRHFENQRLVFYPIINIYIVNKSLGGVENTSIYDVLDKLRKALSQERISYDKYIINEDTITIENEAFVETGGMNFVYVVRIRLKARTYKNE